MEKGESVHCEKLALTALEHLHGTLLSATPLYLNSWFVEEEDIHVFSLLILHPPPSTAHCLLSLYIE